MTDLNKIQKYLLSVFILVGLILRWLYLDSRPLHHDESLHLMYSYYPIDNPSTGYYKYDPMLHGPMLYTLESYIFRLFGTSTFSSRFLPALIGSFFLFIPILFRKFFIQIGGKWSLVLSTAFIALSPSLIYWSRFNIHDPYFILGIIICFLSILSKDKKATIISIGMLFQFCTKENSYVSIAIVSGYLIFEHLYLIFFKEDNNSYTSLLSRALAYCKNNKQDFFIAIIIFAFVFSYLFTSSFRNLGAIDKGYFEFYFGSILDAVYRKSLGYWLNQNSIERIKGPFLFHFYLYLLYEPAFIFLYLASIFLFIKSASEKLLKVFLFSFITYLAITIYLLNTNIEKSSIGQFFKLKDHFDLFALYFFFTHSLLLTIHHLQKKQYNIAFFAYLFTSTLFTYSYLGEKVPWLSQYPIALSVPYFAFVIKELYEKAKVIDINKLFSYLGISLITLALISYLTSSQKDGFEKVSILFGVLFLILSFLKNEIKINLATFTLVLIVATTLNSAILTNFTHAGKANELMSQVHTTYEFDKTIKRIKSEHESNKIGRKYTVYTTGDPVWPTTAYLRGMKGYKYQANNSDIKKMCYVFDSFDNGKIEKPEGFLEKKIPIRGWWVPDYKQVTIKKYLNYLLTHKNWNSSGYSYAKMFVNQNPNCGY